MANATKTTKTLTAGSKGMIVLEPQVYFQRKTNLPDNWLRCRLGIIASVTNLVSLNGTPNAESLISSNVDPKYHFMFGLSNGTSFPVNASNRFVGFKSGNTANNGGDRIIFDSPNWRLNFTNDSSYFGVSHIYDGATTNISAENLSAFDCNFGDPTASSSCMFALGFDIDVRTAATMKLSWVTSGNTNITNASDAAMASFLTTSSYSGQIAVTGGWWDNSTTFCGLQYFAFRFPFLTNRLRILNMMAIQTA